MRWTIEGPHLIANPQSTTVGPSRYPKRAPFDSAEEVGLLLWTRSGDTEEPRLPPKEIRP